MNYISKSLKDQSRHLQQLINKGENLEKALDELGKQPDESRNTQLSQYHAWRIRVLTTCTPLMIAVHQEEILQEIKALAPTSESVAIITGMMRGMLREIATGKLNHVVHMIEKEGIEDLLAQADELLITEGKDITGYNLAAMCVSITLEHAIRKLCEREGLIPKNGKWRPLGTLLDSLKENNVLHEHQLNQLEVWRNIRNDVAHGQFDSFNRSDVEGMIAGVKRFVKDQF